MTGIGAAHSAGFAVETTLDPHRQVHLGIRRDEGDELTRRFFRWEVPSLTDEQQQAIETGVREDVAGLGLHNVADLLAPGHLPFETGIARLPDGGLSVAVWTPFPGTAPAMIDWWFGWHLSSTERYKLWHPQAHAFSQPRMRYDDADAAGVTDRERYVGNTSWVDEYIGPILSRLAITFHDPAEIGLAAADLANAGYGTAICAITADSDHGNRLGRLIHAVRHTDDGCEMRSRFVFPAGTPDFIGGPLLDHCATEMAHLAGFLPQLWAAVHRSPDQA